jgi:regulatory protein
LIPEELLAKAKKDALRLLSFRARSTAELRDKLLKKKHSAEIAEAVLLFCVKQGLLDDEKFAKLYALSRIQSRPTGKKMIQADLRNKGVPPAMVERALGSIADFDEKQIALEMALRRHQRMTQLPQNISKARLYGFLKRRGFTHESVFYALSKLYRQSDPF